MEEIFFVAKKYLITVDIEVVNDDGIETLWTGKITEFDSKSVKIKTLVGSFPLPLSHLKRICFRGPAWKEEVDDD